jgi:hypothetical protein
VALLGAGDALEQAELVNEATTAMTAATTSDGRMETKKVSRRRTVIAA